jgi:prepilin-type N-terminal cleavage/methylation domain-containing protein
MRRAFTILELLAATALTAILMAAVLHVVGAISASRAVLARQADAGAAWRADFLDLLRRDMTNASKVTLRPDQMTLTGRAALDAETLEFRHEPVNVVYGLSVIDGRSWLVRRQSPRDGWSSSPPWAELVCPDVTGLVVQRVSSTPGTLAPSVAANGMAQDVPAAVTVSLVGADGVIMRETVVLR